MVTAFGSGLHYIIICIISGVLVNRLPVFVFAFLKTLIFSGFLFSRCKYPHYGLVLSYQPLNNCSQSFWIFDKQQLVAGTPLQAMANSGGEPAKDLKSCNLGTRSIRNILVLLLTLQKKNLDTEGKCCPKSPAESCWQIWEEPSCLGSPCTILCRCL